MAGECQKWMRTMTLLGKWLAADCEKMAAKNTPPVLLALQLLTLHAHEFSEELRTESDIDLCLWAWLVDETLRQVERGVRYVPDDMASDFRQMLEGLEADCEEEAASRGAGMAGAAAVMQPAN